jgi:hypothetical protein
MALAKTDPERLNLLNVNPEIRDPLSKLGG